MQKLAEILRFSYIFVVVKIHIFLTLQVPLYS